MKLKHKYVETEKIVFDVASIVTKGIQDKVLKENKDSFEEITK